MESINESLTTEWSEEQESFSTGIQGQMHEAVIYDEAGNYEYVPKVQYIYVHMDSSQKEFRQSRCVTTKKITFNFDYNRMVAMITRDVLQKGSPEYTRFVGFLNKAQDENYEEADSVLDTLMGDTKSTKDV